MQTISTFLASKPEIFENSEIKSKSKFNKHQSKTMTQLKNHKKVLQKKLNSPQPWSIFQSQSLEQTKTEYWKTVRAISDLKKHEKNIQDMKTTAHQEKLFNKNRWNFSKQLVRGELGKVNSVTEFSKVEADKHFSSTYSTPIITNFDNLIWFPNLPTDPGLPDFKPYDMSPIKPKDVLNALKHSNKNSSPGPDGIPYALLFHLKSTHHILATTYNKVLKYGAPPLIMG